MDYYQTVETAGKKERWEFIEHKKHKSLDKEEEASTHAQKYTNTDTHAHTNIKLRTEQI